MRIGEVMVPAGGRSSTATARDRQQARERTGRARCMMPRRRAAGRAMLDQGTPTLADAERVSTAQTTSDRDDPRIDGAGRRSPPPSTTPPTGPRLQAMAAASGPPAGG